VEQKLIAWRRDIHQHPELGDREQRTAKLVAEHLRSLGLQVRTGVARTGVVGILKGAKPGAAVALRADTAEVLAGMRAELHGTVVFIFQPAEEGSTVVDLSSGKTRGPN
jgi:amidohydrolase